MITLINIKKTSDAISADFYVEKNPQRGFIEMQLDTGRITEFHSVGYGSIHAKYAIERLAKMDNPPKEKTELWY